MQNILAGQTLTASTLNNWGPVAVTGIVTPNGSFSVASFTAYKIAGVTFFSVLLAYSGATITASSAGLITSTLCCTLPFAPQATAFIAYDNNGTSDGILECNTSGQCTLKSLCPTAQIVASTNVGFSGVILTG